MNRSFIHRFETAGFAAVSVLGFIEVWGHLNGWSFAADTASMQPVVPLSNAICFILLGTAGVLFTFQRKPAAFGVALFGTLFTILGWLQSLIDF